MRKYSIKYKVVDRSYYCWFTCYAETEREAIKLFILNVDGIVEDRRVVYVEDVK